VQPDLIVCRERRWSDACILVCWWRLSSRKAQFGRLTFARIPVVENGLHSNFCSAVFFVDIWWCEGAAEICFFRAISFFVESIFHGNPDANSCSSFFMQFIFHAAHFSCSLFFMQLIMSLRCRFQNFSCHSAGIVWLPLIMQVTVFRLALTVCDS